jgi:hypothetical protein
MKTLLSAGTATLVAMLVTGCASPPPAISVARALCEIKMGFIKDEAHFPNTKIGVIPSTISIELVVEATKTSKGQLELGLARASTPTTAGLLFNNDREHKNKSTITINFVNRLTLDQNTIAGRSKDFHPNHSTEFSAEAGSLIDSLFPDAQRPGKESGEPNYNFDCASLDKAG